MKWILIAAMAEMVASGYGADKFTGLPNPE